MPQRVNIGGMRHYILRVLHFKSLKIWKRLILANQKQKHSFVANQKQNPLISANHKSEIFFRKRHWAGHFSLPPLMHGAASRVDSKWKQICILGILYFCGMIGQFATWLITKAVYANKAKFYSLTDIDYTFIGKKRVKEADYFSKHIGKGTSLFNVLLTYAKTLFRLKFERGMYK